MRVLYIGGTGEISFACVEAAKRAGHEVTIYNRGKRFDADLLGVRQIVGDFTDHDSYATLASGGFDVVCQFLAYSPESVERDIETFAGRCDQYVFISYSIGLSKAQLHDAHRRRYAVGESLLGLQSQQGGVRNPSPGRPPFRSAARDDCSSEPHVSRATSQHSCQRRPSRVATSEREARHRAW